MKHRMPLACFALVASLTVQAGVTVESAWVRATVPGQAATGAYLSLRSSGSAALVGVSSPVAAVADLHQMTLEGGVMKMRALPRLVLPAGKAVELKPGGYHIMLMDLKRPMVAGESVPLTLRIESAEGRTESIEVKAEVRALAAMPAEGRQHHHH